jgi:hypothetical protein
VITRTVHPQFFGPPDLPLAEASLSHELPAKYLCVE